MLKDIFRKSDIILIVLLLIIGTISSIAVSLSGTVGKRVTIEASGKPYGTYSLNTNKKIVVKNNGNSNTVVIKDGSVSITSSTCRNKVCVNHAPINKEGESIICLPNKVIVKIEGKGEDHYDAISG